jgi:hypothetical protein
MGFSLGDFNKALNPSSNGVAKAFSSQGAAQNFDGIMNSAVNGSSSGAVVGSTDGGPAKFTQKGGVVSKPEEFLDPRTNGFNDAMKETAAGLSKVGNAATDVLNSVGDTLTGAAETAKDSVLDMTTMLLIGGGVVLVVLLMKDN